MARTIQTYEDLIALPDDGNRYELLDGEIVMAPSPNAAHQGALAVLAWYLISHVRQYRLGRVYFAPFDVVLSETNAPQPDLLFISNERLAILTPANVQGAPDLVVEVLSPSNPQQDRVRKMGIYARHGVPNYWIVDPMRRQVEAFILVDGGYELAVAARDDEVFIAPPFSDLAIPLAELWA